MKQTILEFGSGLAAARGGNVALMVALTLPLLVGAAGSALVYDKAVTARSALQDSVDAAVLAGAALSGNEDSKIQSARQILTANLTNAEHLADITSDFKQEGDLFEGEITASVEHPFGALIGPGKIKVAVNAAARASTLPVCVLGLNGLDNGSFDINGSPKFNAPGCAVQANSGSKFAMTIEGNPEAKAGRFGVTGGHKGDTFSPTPVNGSDKVDDPLANLPFPVHDNCDDAGKEGLVIKASVTLQPGTYCGGISVSGSDVEVTLAPGVYVMVDGPLYLNAKSTMTGERVMFAFTGDDSTLRLWGSSNLRVTSPVSGPYTNIQFLQDRTDSKGRGMWVSIGGSNGDESKLEYDGVAYFPTQNLWMYGNATVKANSPSLAMIADKIWVQGSADVTISRENTRNLDVEAPRQASANVALVR